MLIISYWRKKWETHSSILPGESHGQRSLVGYSPRSQKESDTTQYTHTHTHSILMSLLIHIYVICLLARFYIPCFKYGKLNNSAIAKYLESVHRMNGVFLLLCTQKT